MSHPIVEKLFKHQSWEVGVVNEPIHRFLDPAFAPQVIWMTPRGRNEFRADPFLLPVGDRRVVLYEDFDYRSHVGRISASEIDGTKFLPLNTDIMPIDCHLAYPFTLQHEGRWLCIPETQQQNEVAAWELNPETFQFQKVGTLLNGVPAIDSTVFQHDGLWWLACTRKDGKPQEELHIWFADDLFGRWQPHAGNPVKSDITSSRPAGTPFRHKGQLYRPAQNCRQHYGAGVSINRIVTLTPDAFEEETVRRLKPDANSPYPHGIHTISCLGDYTVVDGLRHTFFASEMLRVLRRGFSKLSPFRG